MIQPNAKNILKTFVFKSTYRDLLNKKTGLLLEDK